MAFATDNQADKPKIEEFYKFSMFTPAPGAEGKRSRLAWSIRDGSPRISVFTNIPNDTQQKGIISAPMNPETFFAFLNMFEKICTGDNNYKMKLDCFTAYKDKDGNMQEKTLLSEVWFGKDEQGICWISLLAPNRPKIRFNFFISDFHRFFKQDGNPLNENESSMLQAKATISCLRGIYISKLNTIKQYNGFTKTNDEAVTSKTAHSTFEEDIPF